MTVTLKDVAEMAGVDPSIVSRVLNGSKSLSVRPETRERILAAAARLNYRPNGVARSLKLRVTRTLAMLVPDITNPIFAEIFTGVERVAGESGYAVILAHTGEHLEKEDPYVRVMKEKRVDGFILATALTSDRIVSELQAEGYPFVLVNRRARDVQDGFVVVDDVLGARLAVEHLVSLGHRRIAHLSGPLFTDTGLGRLQGYRSAVRELGLPFESEWVVECDFREPSGRAGMRKLLAAQNRPTAVFTCNDQVAIGALGALAEAGLRVPDDISVVGFNDLPIVRFLQPPLTTVHLPLAEMGAWAAEMLICKLRGQPLAQPSRIVAPTLIARGSTARPRD